LDNNEVFLQKKSKYKETFEQGVKIMAIAVSDYAERIICNDITVGQLQQKSLEILTYFQSICKEHSLRYWCGGGTCIGALRHKGFIPWDDDIDVFMPRPDYEKLYKIWNDVADTKRYTLSRTDKNKNNHQTDMQLVDLNTTFINRHSVDVDTCHGISIDIIPFEGCPDSKLSKLLQIYHSIMYSVFNVQRLPDHQGKLLRTATKLALAAVKNPERRYKLWKKHEKKMARYDFYTSKTVKETVTSFRALFYSYPREYFEVMEVPFENITVNIPVGAHDYLTRVFGDYMSLPDEKYRTAKHDVVYMSLDEPFSKFRGIYYCVEQNKK